MMEPQTEIVSGGGKKSLMATIALPSTFDKMQMLSAIIQSINVSRLNCA